MVHAALGSQTRALQLLGSAYQEKAIRLVNLTVDPALDVLRSAPEFQGELHVVTSPIQVSVTGVAASVSYAGGYPGTSDTYQLNFVVPSGVGQGSTVLKWSVARIPRMDATITVD